MVTCLSTMISLKSPHLAFSLLPSAYWQKGQPRHLSNRSVLPVLRRFMFKGTSGYLEDFVARIGSPKLDTFEIDIYAPFRPFHQSHTKFTFKCPFAHCIRVMHLPKAVLF